MTIDNSTDNEMEETTGENDQKILVETNASAQVWYLHFYTYHDFIQNILDL